ncbi:MAG: hypothetical protein IKO36_05635 [Bacteroidaceae bacterium]|nr:hypothetical protein [Bacteroidaceae bacterium]
MKFNTRKQMMKDGYLKMMLCYRGDNNRNLNRQHRSRHSLKAACNRTLDKMMNDELNKL